MLNKIPSSSPHFDLANIDLVIFDCDGVLIDSEPIASATLARAITKQGFPITAQAAHETFTGHATPVIVGMVAERFSGVDVIALRADWQKELFAAFASDLKPLAGITGLVQNIKRPKCVASNSSFDRLKQSLGLLELWGEFDPHIYSADHVALPKPAPDLMLHCASRLSADPVRCIVIDDSAHGIAAARAAGMQAIGFVDPNDPRTGRTELHLEAGASAVAIGANDLRSLFGL